MNGEALITNLFDTSLARRKSDSNDPVRSVLVLNPKIDPNVLSLLLPTRIADVLGLLELRLNPKRLNPIRLTLRGSTCSVEPFETSGDQIVIGGIPLTALGLMLDSTGQLVDDPYPSR